MIDIYIYILTYTFTSYKSTIHVGKNTRPMDLYGFCFPEKTSDLVEEPSRGTESAYCQRHPKEGAAV